MNVEKTKVMRISRKPSPLQMMIDHKQLKNMENFKYVSSMTKSDARYTRKMKCMVTND
jgi:hypothetical protein